MARWSPPGKSSFARLGLAFLLLSSIAAAAHGAGPDPLAEADRALDDIERVIDDAYFHTALGLIAARRDWLDGLPSQEALASRRARLEVLAATAEIALSRRGQAQQSLRRALNADPRLSLHPQRTPPKVLALLTEARRGSLPGSRP